jgi:hypothetical protein
MSAGAKALELQTKVGGGGELDSHCSLGMSPEANTLADGYRKDAIRLSFYF